MYVVTPKAISAAYIINPYQSLCLYLYLLIVDGQWLDVNVTAAKHYTNNNTTIVGHVVFYEACFVSKDSKRIVLP